MLLKEKYPIYSIEITKDATIMDSADAIVEFLKDKIDNHPIAKFIAIFDHYTMNACALIRRSHIFYPRLGVFHTLSERNGKHA